MDDTEHSYMCKKSYYNSERHFRIFYNLLGSDRNSSAYVEALKIHVACYHMFMMSIHDIKVGLFCRNTNGLEQWLKTEYEKQRKQSK